MEANNGNNRIEEAISGIVSYLRMKLDSIKLDTIEGLAKICAGVIGLLIMVVFGLVGLLMLVGVLTYLLGVAINSLTWAIVIVAAVMIILSVLAFRLRMNLFGNLMVKMFAGMFFKSHDHDGREGGLYE